ncbi:MAG TPA: HD-GYP domain-containing protein [Thermoleophilaceae bacterium]|nr:HD-GYP domain-containing protein [Thermoleophilaceae bacterium]
MSGAETSSLDDLREQVERLRAALTLQEAEAADKEEQLQRYAADLRETFKEERARAQELRESYFATVRALTNAVEARDAYTGKHAERVAAYALEIGATLGQQWAGKPEIEFGFLLHDIGKVAVPDSILHKPEPLTTQERDLIELHPVTGWEIVRQVDFLGAASDVVRHHHERWDGDGYPDGLAAEDIPFTARVFAVADTLDALTTDRPYRPASGFPEARAMVEDGRGTQFDPAVVDALASMSDEVFERIRTEIG